MFWRPMAFIIPLGCLAHPGRGRSGHGLGREALHDDPAQAVQVDQMCELDSIAKSAAGGNNGIFETNGTDADSEVNPRGPFGDACRLGRTHCGKV